MPLVHFGLFLLTAALGASTPSNATQVDDATTTALSKLSGATLDDGTSILTKNGSDDAFQLPSVCPPAEYVFTVKASIFPGRRKEELDSVNVSAFVQSCLCLAKKNPAKAFSVCTQLSSLSYAALLGTEGSHEPGRYPEKGNKTARDYMSDNQITGAAAGGFVSLNEKSSASTVLHRLRKGLADVFPLSFFAVASTRENDVVFPPPKTSHLSDGNSWKYGFAGQDLHINRRGDGVPIQRLALNLGTLFCRNLAEFQALGCACGVMKFVEASSTAAHASPPCAPRPRDSFPPASPTITPLSPEAFCGGVPQPAVDLPLVPLQEYNDILSFLGNTSMRIPAPVVEREGLTYSRLWEAIDRLYNFHRSTHCLPNLCHIPCLLPGWTPELVVDVTEPRLVQSNPLCVFVRKDTTLLIVIRGAITSAEWALATEYNLVDFSPSHDENLGKVSAGILQIYASIWPTLQTFLGTSKKQQAVERILITGHSMGAAAGTLLSLALANSSVFKKRVDAVLFASPRSGDTRFMYFWRKRVNGRVVQFSLDMITGVPCLRMPVCEARTTYTDAKVLATELPQVHRLPQAYTRTKPSFVAYEYGDYHHTVIFGPTELPNAPDQQPAHIHYNHYCAYACWLATRFDNSMERTMCNKNVDMDNSANDPTVCPKKL